MWFVEPILFTAEIAETAETCKRFYGVLCGLCVLCGKAMT